MRNTNGAENRRQLNPYLLPECFGPLALATLRRLFEVAAELHFPEDALALHFLLQGAQGLIDIVVADVDLHGGVVLLSS